MGDFYKVFQQILTGIITTLFSTLVLKLFKIIMLEKNSVDKKVYNDACCSVCNKKMNIGKLEEDNNLNSTNIKFDCFGNYIIYSVFIIIVSIVYAKYQEILIKITIYECFFSTIILIVLVFALKKNKKMIVLKSIYHQKVFT
jgi:hypothetical protein